MAMNQNGADDQNQLLESQEDGDFAIILDEFRDMFKLVSGEELCVDKAQLKDIYETMGVQIVSQEDFDEKFDEMDENKDGLVNYQELEDYLSAAMQQERGDSQRDGSFSQNPFAAADENDGTRQLTLEFISIMTKLFEDNKVHESALAQHEDAPAEEQKTTEAGEFVADIARLRQKVEQDPNNEEQDLLGAFDDFFKRQKQNDKKFIAQSEFSQLVRDNELQLLGGAFQVTDLEGKPLPASDSAVSHHSSPYVRESEEIREKEGNLNLANFSIEALQEDSEQPQVRIQELLQIFLDYDNYTDFRKKDWSQFFGLLAQKIDVINLSLCQAETDRDAFRDECEKAYAKFEDYTFDTEEERNQRKIMEKDFIETQQKLNEAIVKNEDFSNVSEKNQNLEKLLKDTMEKMTQMQWQLNESQLKEKDNAEKARTAQDQIHELKIEMQALKIEKDEVKTAQRDARAKQYAMLDLDEKTQKQTGLRHSIAFQNSSRMSKIGPSLHRVQSIGSKDLAQNRVSGVKETSRFTVMKDLVTADKELNGFDFEDKFSPFEFTEAMDLTDTREKLYLKILTGISESLDQDDPQYEIQQKAVHSIAAGYVQERKAGDILLAEFREFEETQVQLESDLAILAQENEALKKVHEDDILVISQMHEDLERLEDLNDQLNENIDALEKDLLGSNQIQTSEARATITQRFSVMKDLQNTRMSVAALQRGSVARCSLAERINVIRGKHDKSDLNGLALNSVPILSAESGRESELYSMNFDNSQQNREYGSATSTDFFPSLETRQSTAMPTRASGLGGSIRQKTMAQPAFLAQQSSELLPIEEDTSQGDDEVSRASSTVKTMKDLRPTEGSMINLDEEDDADNQMRDNGTYTSQVAAFEEVNLARRTEVSGDVTNNTLKNKTVPQNQAAAASATKILSDSRHKKSASLQFSTNPALTASSGVVKSRDYLVSDFGFDMLEQHASPNDNTEQDRGAVNNVFPSSQMSVKPVEQVKPIEQKPIAQVKLDQQVKPASAAETGFILNKPTIAPIQSTKPIEQPVAPTAEIVIEPKSINHQNAPESQQCREYRQENDRLRKALEEAQKQNVNLLRLNMQQNQAFNNFSDIPRNIQENNSDIESASRPPVCFNDEADNGEEQTLQPDILDEAKERLLSTNQRLTNGDGDIKDHSTVEQPIVKNILHTEVVHEDDKNIETWKLQIGQIGEAYDREQTFDSSREQTLQHVLAQPHYREEGTSMASRQQTVIMQQKSTTRPIAESPTQHQDPVQSKLTYQSPLGSQGENLGDVLPGKQRRNEAQFSPDDYCQDNDFATVMNRSSAAEVAAVEDQQPRTISLAEKPMRLGAVTVEASPESLDITASQDKKIEAILRANSSARKGWGDSRQTGTNDAAFNDDESLMMRDSTVMFDSRDHSVTSNALLTRDPTEVLLDTMISSQHIELQSEDNDRISGSNFGESNDIVFELQDKKTKHVVNASIGRSSTFDEVLGDRDGNNEDGSRNTHIGGIEEERKTTNRLMSENRAKKINEIMTRASNIRSSGVMQFRQTLMERTTTVNKNFDYLFLRKSDNTRFYKQVQAILHQYYEDSQIAVFSEIVQMYDAKMEVTEMIILITAQSVYMLDRQCNLRTRCELQYLKEIILVKANPCFFALSFLSGQSAPLILQSFRRAELMIYILSKREKSIRKPKVVVGDAIKLIMKSGKTRLLEFDKALQSQGNLNESQKRLLETSQLNNFVNALACGYMELMSKGLFGGKNWSRQLVVLSNVGLLHFKDPLQPPVDLFPILNCRLIEVDPVKVEGSTTVFRLENGRKQITFRCGSLSEYVSWTKAIEQLQSETEARRKTTKVRELARITELNQRGFGVGGNQGNGLTEVSGMSSFRIN